MMFPDILNDMELVRPLWLLLGLLPLALIVLTRFRAAREQRFADRELLPWLLIPRSSRQRQSFLRVLLKQTLIWSLLGLALAGPRLEQRDSSAGTGRSGKLVLVMDISRSMLTRDVRPSRLVRAQQEVLQLVNAIKNTQIGIVAWAGKSLVVSPLSHDRSVTRFYLQRLSTTMIPVHGSGLEQALQQAAGLLPENKTAAAPAHQVLIVSDGELSKNTETRKVLATVRLLQNRNIRIHTLVTGSRRGGPVPDPKKHWFKYKNRIVYSRPDFVLMQRIAQQGNGSFHQLKPGEFVTPNLLRRIQYGIGSRDSADSNRIWTELFHIPLLLAMIVILLSLVTNAWRLNLRTMSLIVIIVTLTACNKNPDRQQFNQAVKAYRDGHYHQAVTLLGTLDSYRSHFVAGNASYRLKKYGPASFHYARAFNLARNDHHRALMLFNLGNAYFHGEQLPAALEAWSHALRYNPDLQQAETNYRIGRKYYRTVKGQTIVDNTVTSRVGKGPRFRRAVPGLDLDRGSAGIDENRPDDKKSEFAYDAGKKRAPGKGGKARLERKQTSAKDKGRVSDKIRLSPYRLNELSHRIRTMSPDGTMMWKRLFFYEQKIFIPEDREYTPPGHKPW